MIYPYTDDDERAVGCLFALSESLGIDFMAYANLRAQFIYRRALQFTKGRDFAAEVLRRLREVDKRQKKASRVKAPKKRQRKAAAGKKRPAVKRRVKRSR